MFIFCKSSEFREMIIILKHAKKLYINEINRNRINFHISILRYIGCGKSSRQFKNIIIKELMMTKMCGMHDSHQNVCGYFVIKEKNL